MEAAKIIRRIREGRVTKGPDTTGQYGGEPRRVQGASLLDFDCVRYSKLLSVVFPQILVRCVKKGRLTRWTVSTLLAAGLPIVNNPG